MQEVTPGQGWQQQLAHWRLSTNELVDELNLEHSGDRIELNWDEKLSQLSPIKKLRNHITIYGYKKVNLASGAELAVSGIPNEQTHLFIDKLILDSGARIRLQTDSWVFIRQLEVCTGQQNVAAELILKPATAESGHRGNSGQNGADNTVEGLQGGHGGAASAGTNGEDGSVHRRAFVRIGHLKGHLHCIASAADGGDGGDGGNGGAGGNSATFIGGNGGQGGNGGNGGNASSGGEMFVMVDYQDCNSGIRQSTPIPLGGQGGKGGQGGLGGDGGSGISAGQTGGQGADGRPGLCGQCAKINVRLVQCAPGTIKADAC